MPGFPWHPHRGIETVTYIISGKVEHGDSIGNSGVIGPADAQWMTAGKGIIHQEMPKTTGEPMWGLQLWVNLPKAKKWCPPRYQDIPADKIPDVVLDDGSRARLVCGSYHGTTGPVNGIAVDPLFMDVFLPAGGVFAQDIPEGHSVFCYALDGKACFDEQSEPLEAGHLVLFEAGDGIRVAAAGEEARFLVVSGRILGEPVSRGGPFVMNTREEIEQAYQEYRDGTFLDR